MYVYILANDTNVCIYTGVTNDLARRLYEHKHELNPDSFTAKHHLHKLVWFEETGSIIAAIEREKQIKSWNRKRKKTDRIYESEVGRSFTAFGALARLPLRVIAIQ